MLTLGVPGWMYKALLFVFNLLNELFSYLSMFLAFPSVFKRTYMCTVLEAVSPLSMQEHNKSSLAVIQKNVSMCNAHKLCFNNSINICKLRWYVFVPNLGLLSRVFTNNSFWMQLLFWWFYSFARWLFQHRVCHQQTSTGRKWSRNVRVEMELYEL